MFKETYKRKKEETQNQRDFNLKRKEHKQDQDLFDKNQKTIEKEAWKEKNRKEKKLDLEEEAKKGLERTPSKLSRRVSEGPWERTIESQMATPEKVNEKSQGSFCFMTDSCKNEEEKYLEARNLKSDEVIGEKTKDHLKEKIDILRGQRVHLPSYLLGQRLRTKFTVKGDNDLKSQGTKETDLKQFKIKREETMAHPVEFNVLVLGAENSGKTNYIRRFFHSKFGQNFKVSKHKHSQIWTGEMRDEGIAMNVNFFDTKGYGDILDSKIWAKNIKGIIGNGMQLYRNSKRTHSQALADLDQYNESYLAHVKDSRIHLALYFLSGTRIKFVDFYFMKKFSKFVNILPILAHDGSRSMASTDEVKNLKNNLRKEADQCGIHWVNLEQV